MLHLSIQHTGTNGHTQNSIAHPLLTVLESVHANGSIVKAAKQLERSYRHVWGELKHWESVLDTHLIVWGRNGKGAELTPQAVEFLASVSKLQVDLAPQIAQIKNSFQQCVTTLKISNTEHCSPPDVALLTTSSAKKRETNTSVTKV